jgi:hypothetical protein
LKFGGFGKLIEQVHAAFERLCDVFDLDRFRWVVADSAGGPQKNHCSGNFIGEDHGVVAGTTGHAVRLAACAADGFLNLIDEKRIHRYCALAQENILPQRQAAAFGNFVRHSNECFDCAIANVVGLVANIQSYASFRGDYVCGSGSCFDLAHGSNKPRVVMSRALDRNDPLCGGSDGIVAKMHWGRARMVGAAQEFERHAGLCSDGVYCTELPPE